MAIHRPTIKKPNGLGAGARIGIVALSGPFESEPFALGIARLKSWGFDPVIPAGLDRQGPANLGYLAGADDFRAATLEQFFLDGDIDAIWAARGGYGAMRILRAVDPAIIRANPKLFVGFSDVTALHSHMLANAGVACLNGPNVTTLSGVTETDATTLRRVLGGFPAGSVRTRSLQALRPGRSTGQLVGGNLSVLVSLVGSAYFPPVDGAILFLEDIGEKPYRIDRMLTHLDLAGILGRAAGVLLGDFHECAQMGARIDDVLRDRLGGLSCPVIAGFPSGHGSDHFPLPLGTSCELDADANIVNFPEPLCG